MSERNYDNSGILFENDDKQQPKHPDMKGQLTVGGKRFWLSAWHKTGAKGPFISIAVKPMEPRPISQPAAQPQSQSSDVPF